MPLKVNVGLSKKIGQPDFGSLGATCNVEFEAEATLLQSDPGGFHRQVRNAYAAAAQAVNDELGRHQGQTGGSRNGTAGQSASPPSQASAPSNGNGGHGNGNDDDGGNGNGRNGHRPSEKQMTYLRQLAGQIRGLGIRKLDALAQKMYGKPVAALSTLDASGLIDTLKGVKAGEIDLDAALGGAAS